MKKAALFGIIILSLIFVYCGDDEIQVDPGDILLFLNPEIDTISLGDSLDMTASVFNSSNRQVNWSVNDIPDGNSDYGTLIDVTDTSAIYVSPSALTITDSVFVVVQSQADASIVDSAKIVLKDPVYVHVDADNGSDLTGSGTSIRPYKTITKGIQEASTGQQVYVHAGTYMEGETFPLQPNFGISITGENEDLVTIVAPAGTDPASAAILIRYDLSSIQHVRIVGTSGSGVGIFLSPPETADTTSITLANVLVDSCYYGIFSSAEFRSFTIEANSLDEDSLANYISHCEIGIKLDAILDSLEINRTSVTNCNTMGIDASGLFGIVRCRDNYISNTPIGFSLASSTNAVFQRNEFASIDSISFYNGPGAFANLGIQLPLEIPGDNVFDTPGSFILYNANSATIYAQFNYWPVSDSSSIDALIYDDDEDAGSGNVVFMPINTP